MCVGVCECATCGRECNCTNVLNYGQLGESSVQMAFMNEEMLFFRKTQKRTTTPTSRATNGVRSTTALQTWHDPQFCPSKIMLFLHATDHNLKLSQNQQKQKAVIFFSLQKLIISDSVGLCMYGVCV